MAEKSVRGKGMVYLPKGVLNVASKNILLSEHNMKEENRKVATTKNLKDGSKTITLICTWPNCPKRFNLRCPSNENEDCFFLESDNAHIHDDVLGNGGIKRKDRVEKVREVVLEAQKCGVITPKNIAKYASGKGIEISDLNQVLYFI